MIVWSQPGNAVYLTGSFNNWQKKIRLQQSVEDFSTVVDMPPGEHQLKFIVDDVWKCSEDLPTVNDKDGNMVNVIKIDDEEGRSILDGLEDLTINAKAVQGINYIDYRAWISSNFLHLRYASNAKVGLECKSRVSSCITSTTAKGVAEFACNIG